MSVARETIEEERLPQSGEAETSVLGACLIEPAAVPDAAEVLAPEDFYHDAHRHIFRAICALWEAGEAVDPITVISRLRDAGYMAQCGGASYLMGLLQAVPTAANRAYHIRIVRDKAVLRRVIEGCRATILDAVEDGVREPAVVIEAGERRLQEAEGRARAGGFQPAKASLWKAMEQIEKEGTAKDGVTGFPTGLPRLDQVTAGLQRGDLTVVAARPAMGKTALCLQIAAHIADVTGEVVAVESLEMSDGQLAKRVLASRAAVDLLKIRKGEVTREEYERLARASTWYSALPLMIDDQMTATLSAVRAKARRLRSARGLAVLMVDYLQLMEAEGRSRVEQVSRISRGLKQMARELEVHVLAISQLSRGPENRHRPRPMLSDLRESGSIEQDADNVLLLWRPEYYFDDKTPDKQQAEYGGKGELIIAKQRNGPASHFWLGWEKATTTFRDLALERDERRAEEGGKPWEM